MTGRFDSRNPLIGLTDEISRLNGRLKSTFATSRQVVGLGDSEMMVLNAVVEAERAPTVSQIGRSLGHPRQLIQRAANALVQAGLIEDTPNPDHKRAVLFIATQKGRDIKQQADNQADLIAAELSNAIDMQAISDATRQLHNIRTQLESHLRKRGI